ncbi:MAG: chemotaxis protein CheD [Pseudomonadota bacterium]
MTAILGSCVATVLWDPVAQVGGMNHLLVPPRLRSASGFEGADINLMELLINAILTRGGARDRLQAKVFGGASMIAGLGSTGARNGVFALEFLAEEGIPVTARSLGGSAARRLQVWPAAGRVLQKRMEVLSSQDMALGTQDASEHVRALALSGVELL